MTFSEKLEEYARLTARIGVNVKEGKYVIIRCAVTAAEFGRMVAKECFALGAKDVIFIWEDQQASRIRYDNADISCFEKIPDWAAEQRNYYARKGCVCINIISEDPEAYAGVSGEKMLANAIACDKAFKEFYHVMDTGNLRWTIVAHPNAKWAKKVFPELSEAQAVKKLWNAIFKSVRIGGRGSCTDKWQKHDAVLKRRAKALNDAAFKKLRYRNSLGTDFTVGLADKHIWMGGSEETVDGVPYIANMPTEEIYTMPDCRVAEGHVAASLPLSYQGEMIEDFTLDFHDGKVVSFDAKKGKDALQRLLATDEGSLSLGEVALIPYSSAISKMGILFYNTLFDENASCHLALGDCYPNTMVGGEKLDREELLKKGGNHSANHVDFMIGTSDMEIVGIKEDGSEQKIFENGEFVI